MSDVPEHEPLKAEQSEPEIHVPDYVYDEIGPSFTPAIIVRKETLEFMRKGREGHGR